MSDQYSLYEAKAKLSALVRQVRQGRTVIITVHGQPAAELRPISPSDQPPTLQSRLGELESQGAIFGGKPIAAKPKSFPVGPRKSGALKRFLKDRE